MTAIAFHQLTKVYQTVTALAGLTADVRPGRVTAFLGSNGSGKTTTMRLTVGLAEPTSGSALVNGVRYRQLRHPARVVGAMLDPGFHPNRSARSHLRILAAQVQVSAQRVDELIDLVELTASADRRVGGFSLGMRQRLALASALIGDPPILILDEPFNGLDPAAIHTLRDFLRGFADRGGTVLLSSHLLSEVAFLADDVLIVDRGRLVTAGALADLVPESPAVAVAPTLDSVFAELTSKERMT